MTRIIIKETIQSKIVRIVKVEVVNYTLNLSALCNVMYLDVSGTKVSSVLVPEDGDDFIVNWITDDNLISIVLSKLGLVPLPYN